VKKCRFVMLIALALVQTLYVLTVNCANSQEDPLPVLERYLRASYARDYQEAYKYLSAQDRRLKDERSYVSERGAFSGFTLVVAKKVADFIELRQADKHAEAGHASIKLKVAVPDANKLSTLLLNWDSDKLEELSSTQREEIVAAIEKRAKDKRLDMIEGEETFQLVKENNGWKIFLNWAAGVKLTFQRTLPPNAPIEAEVLQSEVSAKTGETFNVSFKIKNTGKQDIVARISHLVEPYEVRDYLDLVECGFLLPIRLHPGKEEEYTTTYLLRSDTPESVRQLEVTYGITVLQ
jgi:hypothetical protein